MLVISVHASEEGDAGHAPTLHFEGDKVGIGCDIENDLILQHRSVSRRHARLEKRDGQLVVLDLDGRNGTYVNDERVRAATVVYSNDRITIGDFVLEVIETSDFELRYGKGNARDRAIWAAGPDARISDALKVGQVIVRGPRRRRGVCGPIDDNERDLLALIHESPDDDGPRRIYADWLLQQDDPRGELIALQCEPGAPSDARAERKRRLDELTRIYVGRWLSRFMDPEGEVVGDNESPSRPIELRIRDWQPTGVALERGFLRYPLCLSPAQLREESDWLLRIAPALYKVEQEDPLLFGIGMMGHRALIHGPRGPRGQVTIKCFRHSFELDRAPSGATYTMAYDNEARMRHEAQIGALVSHPNLAQVYGLAYWGRCGELALAMEPLDGKRADSFIYIQELLPWPIAPGFAAAIASRLCLALHCLHTACNHDGLAMELVHNRVHPDKVFITSRGEVKLTDLSTVRGIHIPGSEDLPALTIPRIDAWSRPEMGYLSPEQAAEESVTRQSDVFQTGVLLYELSCGRSPFYTPEISVPDLLAAIRDGRFEPPSGVVDIPPQLERIVMRAMARRPEDRYASALEMHRELEAFIATTGRTSEEHDVAHYSSRMGQSD